MLQAAAARDDAADDAESPMTAETPPRRRAATSREGKTLAGGYIDKTNLFTIQELCLRLSRERGYRVTMQEFAVEAFTEKCERHGVKLPVKS